MNIFKINQLLKECQLEFDLLKERWERTGQEEDRQSVAVKLIEIQILEEWLDQEKKEIRNQN
ncbi:MAG: hypothetical protein H0Z33_05535 [Bacillaceae bacterium]|nr:hypothetical protein [Bacillaceae bacterium]